MADRTKIEWTDATINPIRARRRDNGKVGHHCVHKSAGCQFCYAERMNLRLGTGLPFKPGHEKDIELYLDEKALTQPLRWRKPRMIFPCSMTDMFADFVSDEWITKILAVMALTPHHTYQPLTKRSGRMRRYLQSLDMPALEDAENLIAAHHLGRRPDEHLYPLPNVWWGVSAEDQPTADERVPDLLETPAAVRWVSAEPLLGPIDFRHIDLPGGDYEVFPLGFPPDRLEEGEVTPAKLDWIVAGGESGPHARPIHPDWARSIRDQCQAAGVAFHFKQWGEWLAGENLALTKPWPPATWQDGETGQHSSCRDSKGREWPDGRGPEWRHFGVVGEPGAFALKVGKKRAGRLLDGRTHDEYPGLQSR